MSDRDGSTFATAPVAAGGGRPPWLVAGLVVAVVAGSFALARLTPGPDPGEALETARPRPSPTLARVEPSATALPLREWFTAPEAPIDDVLVTYQDSVRWLRLGNALHPGGPLAQPGRDLLMQGPRDGTVCLCWRPTGADTGDATALDLVSLDDDLRQRARSTVTLVDGLDGPERPNGPTKVALEPSPDGRFAYLARASRSATAWQVGLDVIDLATGAIVDTTDLLPTSTTDRSTVMFVERPTARIAPDGRTAFVMAGVQRQLSSGRLEAANRAWMIRLDGPLLGHVESVDAIAAPGDAGPIESCSWVAFASPDVIATACRHSADSSTSFEIRRYDLVGHDLGPIAGDASHPDPLQVLIDSANGVAFTWDPLGHTLYALDLMQGGWRMAGLAADDRDNPTEVVRLGPRPQAPGPLPIWSDGRSATDRPAERTLIGSPDGRLLFAIGTGAVPDSGLGVRVFDARTLRLLERWPGLSAYSWVTVFERGRFLAVLGRPGVTASGEPADWAASVTIHDTATGQPVVRIAELGVDDGFGFPRMQPRVAPP